MIATVCRNCIEDFRAEARARRDVLPQPANAVVLIEQAMIVDLEAGSLGSGYRIAIGLFGVQYLSGFLCRANSVPNPDTPCSWIYCSAFGVVHRRGTRGAHCPIEPCAGIAIRVSAAFAAIGCMSPVGNQEDSTGDFSGPETGRR